MSRHDSSDSIHDTLNHLLIHLHQRSPARGPSGSVLEVLWKASAGDYLARHARPLGFSGGILRVGVMLRSLLPELEQLTPDLLERLRSNGRLQVRGIRFELVTSLDRPGQRNGVSTADAAAVVEPPSAPAAPDLLAVDPDVAGELPPVREELRPFIHRLLARHQERQAIQRQRSS